MGNYLIIQQIVVSLQSFSEINDEEISFPNVFDRNPVVIL